MRKLFMYLPLAALMFATACDKDDDAKSYVIEIPNYVNLTSWDIDENFNKTSSYMFSSKSGALEVVSTTNCTPSLIMVKLPLMPNKKYLYNATDGTGNALPVSDSQAWIGTIGGINIFYDEQLDFLLKYLFDGDFDAGYVRFYYADRDVTIDGNYSYISTNNVNTYEEYDNVTLKKGWNKVACRRYVDENQEGQLSRRTYYSMDIPTDAYWAIAYPGS